MRSSHNYFQHLLDPQKQQQHQYPAYAYQQPPSGQPQYYPQPGAPPPPQESQPGSYAPPQGAYGQPPPTAYPQSNVPHTKETPPHVRQDYAPPPPQGSYALPPPQGAYGQPPPPTYPQSSVLHTNETSPPHVKQDPRLVTFKFSGTKATIRDARVTDQWGRTVGTISSTKKKTTMCNMSGHPVAVIEWNHSHPHIVYRGEETKSRDFLPLDRKQMVRGMKHNNQTYGWKGSEDKMLVELFATSAPNKRLAYWHTEEDENKQSVIYLEALPEVYETGMLDICLIATFLMNCGTALEDHSYNPPHVLINVLSALINAA